MREIVLLSCTVEDCALRNYSTTRNKTNMAGKLEIAKYCPSCRKRTPHKEVKA